MFGVFQNPWVFFWLAVLVIVRNVGGAFPEPDPNVKGGFGSSSPGYRFLYTFARAMTMDLKTVGIDTKSMALKLKTPTDGTATTTKGD